MTPTAASTVDNPFFARIWPVVAAHETKAIRALRWENLAGLSGRVLEVGAGVGTNFAFYPESVEQMVAIEPEPRLAARARAAAVGAPVPVVDFETRSPSRPVEAALGYQALFGGVVAQHLSSIQVFTKERQNALPCVLSFRR